MNTSVPSKKLIIMGILDILKRYSDENHRLSQREIEDRLENKYGITADRKSIKRNLMELIDFGFNINYSETRRVTPNRKTKLPEETVILSDFYLERDFTEGELRLLIDGLLFSKHIPYSQCRELIEKLEGLSSVHFRSRVKHIRTMPDNAPLNKQLFLTIETMDEAISEGKQVKFLYNEYGTDKRLHPRINSAGQIREYIVNPYQMAAVNGRYYLICNYDKYDNAANYRLDRISEIKLLDTPAKPMHEVKGLEHGLNLPRHMAEHVYMFTGESVRVTFTAKKYILNEVIDWLGTGIDIISEDDEQFTARVTMNYEAMVCWALQYARHVRVISPQSMVEKIKDGLRQSWENYEM